MATTILQPQDISEDMLPEAGYERTEGQESCEFEALHAGLSLQPPAPAPGRLSHNAPR